MQDERQLARGRNWLSAELLSQHNVVCGRASNALPASEARPANPIDTVSVLACTGCISCSTSSTTGL